MGTTTRTFWAVPKWVSFPAFFFPGKVGDTMGVSGDTRGHTGSRDQNGEFFGADAVGTTTEVRGGSEWVLFPALVFPGKVGHTMGVSGDTRGHTGSMGGSAVGLVPRVRLPGESGGHNGCVRGHAWTHRLESTRMATSEWDGAESGCHRTIPLSQRAAPPYQPCRATPSLGLPLRASPPSRPRHQLTFLPKTTISHPCLQCFEGCRVALISLSLEGWHTSIEISQCFENCRPARPCLI